MQTCAPTEGNCSAKSTMNSANLKRSISLSTESEQAKRSNHGSKQTAGHDALGSFAPEFAHLNDDILFGEVWNRTNKLGLKERSIVTTSALIGKGIVDSSLKYHLATAHRPAAGLAT